jgi:hypothetical protein
MRNQLVFILILGTAVFAANCTISSYDVRNIPEGGEGEEATNGVQEGTGGNDDYSENPINPDDCANDARSYEVQFLDDVEELKDKTNKRIQECGLFNTIPSGVPSNPPDEALVSTEESISCRCINTSERCFVYLSNIAQSMFDCIEALDCDHVTDYVGVDIGGISNLNELFELIDLPCSGQIYRAFHRCSNTDESNLVRSCHLNLDFLQRLIF